MVSENVVVLLRGYATQEAGFKNRSSWEADFREAGFVYVQRASGEVGFLEGDLFRKCAAQEAGFLRTEILRKRAF